MITPPIQAKFLEISEPTADYGGNNNAWVQWAEEVSRKIKYQGEFATADRPVNNMVNGDWGIDTTLGKPIWYYSSGWIDATGASV